MYCCLNGLIVAVVGVGAEGLHVFGAKRFSWRVVACVGRCWCF